MRQVLKFLHELSAIGVVGALAAHIVLVWTADPASLQGYIAVRNGIDAVCKWILMPSLAVVLISGLLAIVATRGYMDARWPWIKALLGISMFEGTLGAVVANAKRGSQFTEKVASGAADPQALAEVLRSEWIGLWTIMALALANVAIGVWRPRFALRPAVPRKDERVARPEDSAT